MSLTLFSQWTLTAISDPSSINDTQGPIPLWSTVLRIERVIGRTAQSAVRLQLEVSSSTASYPCSSCPPWCSVCDGGSLINDCGRQEFLKGLSNVGSAHECRIETVSYVRVVVRR